jgi:hypothetical protein
VGLRETLVNEPKLDPSKVGISFVDLLFAAVVPFQLQALDHWWRLRPVGWVQVSTSLVLLLTSWVGYHNSSSRSRWLIDFVNLPLLIFVLDILMVLIYGFSAFAAEVGATTGTSERCSPVPMAIAVALTFVLYVLWDRANLTLKETCKYQRAWRTAHDDEGMTVRKLSDVPRRRHITMAFCAAFIVVAVVSASLDSQGDPVARTIVVNAILILLLVSFRLTKEWQGSEPPHETIFVEAGELNPSTKPSM